MGIGKVPLAQLMQGIATELKYDDSSSRKRSTQASSLVIHSAISWLKNEAQRLTLAFARVLMEPGESAVSRISQTLLRVSISPLWQHISDLLSQAMGSGTSQG